MDSRLRIGAYLVIAVVSLVVLRLWQLQILDGDSYRRLSEENRLRIIRSPAPRGIIFDRNKVPVVENIPAFSVLLSAESLDRIDFDALARLLGMTDQELQEKVGRRDLSPFIPVKLRQGVSFREVAQVEARRSDFPGLFIETEVGRGYPFGKAGAHLIGYLGRVTPSQAGRPEYRHLPSDAQIGQWGVEALFDDRLRGRPGERIIEVDALGRELRLIRQHDPVRGSDIDLTIDILLHKAVENSFGQKAGALVAIEPSTGEVLALESVPSFDPNAFTRGLTAQEWAALRDNRKKPLLNRALQSQYPPGSIFKIITAVAALQEGVINPETKIHCSGSLSHGRYSFGCWRRGGHGLVDFHKALVESCDVYYYEIGRRLGIDRIAHYARLFGFGKETGIKVAQEKKGLMPTTEWKKENKGLPWYLGDTFISAIGQGFITATPVQAALMTSIFAAEGLFHEPVLVRTKESAPHRLDLRPETLSLVRKALIGVVQSPNGTARGAHSYLTSIAGKTGTAQVAGKMKGAVEERFMDHAWFVAFAPAEAPRIAVSVFVEHGGGGGAVAAPIAKRAIEAYLKVRQEPAERRQRQADQPEHTQQAVQQENEAQHRP